MDLSLDYIAGLIDADGSISISKKNWKQGKYSYQYWNFIINFRQLEISREVVEAVQTKIGAGKIYNHKGGGTKKMLTWQTTKHDEAAKVCELLLPYLHIKVFQASELIRAVGVWNSYKVGQISHEEADCIIGEIALSLNNNNQTETSRRNKDIRIGVYSLEFEEILGVKGSKM